MSSRPTSCWSAVEERVKLTDFGLARAAEDVSLTQTGFVAGTPLYMAPEQASGIEIDSRADLFSLGSVLYAMAAGKPPFEGSTPFVVLKSVTEAKPRRLKDSNPAIPDWFEAIVTKLLAKRPEDRYQTAQEVAEHAPPGLEHGRAEAQPARHRPRGSPTSAR